MLNAVIQSMRCAPIFLLAVLASWPLALQAAPLTELSQTELRETVNSGRSVSVKDALKAVRQLVPGDPVDVRAFDGNGVFYRVLVMQASGVVRAIVIDASTGKVLPPSSPTAREVNAKASSKAGASAVSTNKTKKAANAPSNGKSAGKGNSGNGGGGSGGGNSGGNGGGNSGGNGGGNSGGNGGGNSGGNGGGNSGGNGGGNGKGGGNARN